MTNNQIARDALVAFIGTAEGKLLMESLVAGATFLRVVEEACQKAREQGRAEVQFALGAEAEKENHL